MIKQIEISNLQLEDYRELLVAMKAAYPLWQGEYWSEGAINKILKQFPEGQIVIKADGKVVGCALSIIVDYDAFGDVHTYKEITGNYKFDTHNPGGDVLYGVEVFIHPDYRGLRLGRRLYDARKELCENMNLEAIVFGGRIPNYHKYADKITPKEYIQKVKQKEIYTLCYHFRSPMSFM